MDESQRNAALQAEYFHLQKTVEDFDSKALTIKAWSITFSLTVLVGAFATKAYPVFLIAAGSSLLFWVLEALWKSFQLGYYARIETIEQHFRTAKKSTHPFQISEAWIMRWGEAPWSEVWKLGWWPHVALPHVATVIAGLLLFVLSYLKVI